MEFEYQRKEEGIVLVRCYGEEARVCVPQKIEGEAVVRLESYAFSDARRAPDKKRAVCGAEVLEVKLPRSLREIGGYTFYGCRNLEKLTMYHETRDIAGGAFTGCHRLKELEVYMERACGYCLKDLISELRHEIRVTLHYGEKDQAKLLFPEYYEEAVENTPARMLETHFHGSGYSYRQCFRDGVFHYTEYDRLFLEAQAWESEDFCIELSFLRLQFPHALSEEARGCYMSWLMEHRLSAATWCIAFEQEEELEFLGSFIEWGEAEMETLIKEANRRGRIQMQSFLMDYRHRHFPGKKKAFDL